MRKRDELAKGCMAKARDNEMTFVLLGRDAAAPATIRFWIGERLRTGKNQSGDDQIIEAEECARAMEHERSSGAPVQVAPPSATLPPDLAAEAVAVLREWSDYFAKLDADSDPDDRLAQARNHFHAKRLARTRAVLARVDAAGEGRGA